MFASLAQHLTLHKEDCHLGQEKMPVELILEDISEEGMDDALKEVCCCAWFAVFAVLEHCNEISVKLTTNHGHSWQVGWKQINARQMRGGGHPWQGLPNFSNMDDCAFNSR